MNDPVRTSLTAEEQEYIARLDRWEPAQSPPKKLLAIIRRLDELAVNWAERAVQSEVALAQLVVEASRE